VKEKTRCGVYWNERDCEKKEGVAERQRTTTDEAEEAEKSTESEERGGTHQLAL
jgi:hypothetical protein